MFGSNIKDLGPALEHHPPQSAPILLIMIDDQGRFGMIDQISEPFQRRTGALLGFLINGEVSRRLNYRVTNRHDMGLPAQSDGCEARHPSGL